MKWQEMLLGRRVGAGILLDAEAYNTALETVKFSKGS